MVVYKITNNTNGKVYIGQTIQTVERRWNGHVFPSKAKKSVIDMAIRKYGRDNFSIQVIDRGDSVEELNEKEIFWISFCNSVCPNGYNVSLGGSNKVSNEETRNKISKANHHRFIGDKSARSKVVDQYSLSGEFINQFGSSREAGRECGVSSTAISSVCRGEHFYAGEYRWSYQKDNLPDASTKSFRLIEKNGTVKTVKQWSNELGIPYSTLLMRVYKGYPEDKLFSQVDRNRFPLKGR
jgi:hypothetical protein